MKHFSISGSLPPQDPTRSWRMNKTLEVVATDAMKAMQLALEKYPELEIHSLQHRGAIEVIQQEGEGIY